MIYHGIFIAIVCLFLLPEVFHNGYYFFRHGISWRQAIQQDKDGICAQERCLYASRERYVSFYVLYIATRFMIVFLSWGLYGFKYSYILASVIIILICAFLLMYCEYACSLCIVTSEHIFIRCHSTSYKLQKIDIHDISLYKRTSSRSGNIDSIYVNNKVFSFFDIRDDDPLISILDRIVPQETLERNRLDAKKDEADAEKFLPILAVIYLSIPLILILYILFDFSRK